MSHRWTGLSPQHGPVLSPVPIRDKVCGAGAKSLKTLECGREHLVYVVRTTSLPHSLITRLGTLGESKRLWSPC